MAGLEGNSQLTVDGNVIDVDFDNSQSISSISLTDGLNVVEEVDEENENIEVLQIRMKEIAEEKEKFKQIQLEMEKQMELSFFSPKSPPGSVGEDKIETDARSVYVGNVDYNATTQELEEHFHGCGIINRITIPCDKYSGNPKGFAYIEFGDKDSIHIALTLDESLFKGRQIKVIPKRTNKPGISTTNRPPRFASPYLRRYSKINRGMMRSPNRSWVRPY